MYGVPVAARALPIWQNADYLSAVILANVLTSSRTTLSDLIRRLSLVSLHSRVPMLNNKSTEALSVACKAFDDYVTSVQDGDRNPSVTIREITGAL